MDKRRTRAIDWTKEIRIAGKVRRAGIQEQEMSGKKENRPRPGGCAEWKLLQRDEPHEAICHVGTEYRYEVEAL